MTNYQIYLLHNSILPYTQQIRLKIMHSVMRCTDFIKVLLTFKMSYSFIDKNMQTSYSKFHMNWTISVESADRRTPFMTLGKVFFSLCQFSWSSYTLTKMLCTSSTKVYPNWKKNVQNDKNWCLMWSMAFTIQFSQIHNHSTALYGDQLHQTLPRLVKK